MCADAVFDILGRNGFETYERLKRGSYKGDICRAAILYRDGGFYFDADTEWLIPFTEMVDNTTTFMSSWCKFGILNAIQGVTAGNPYILRTLELIVRTVQSWDSWRNDDGLFGPRTYAYSLWDMMREDCPD